MISTQKEFFYAKNILEIIFNDLSCDYGVGRIYSESSPRKRIKARDISWDRNTMNGGLIYLEEWKNISGAFCFWPGKSVNILSMNFQNNYLEINDSPVCARWMVSEPDKIFIFQGRPLEVDPSVFHIILRVMSLSSSATADPRCRKENKRLTGGKS
ncbi:MAG: hypothetical protein PHX98_01420 [Candidatus Moranbacteria bacterium]|nr:hypothetical protein [Candidatus Moranbacteria bacterium]